jgi:hypothetical protein
MDETIDHTIKLILKPHMVSLGLSMLFYLAICLDGRSQYGIPMAIAYFLLVNPAVKSQPIAIDLGQDISDSFLSSFANNLATLGPEQAFSEALKGTSSSLLWHAFAKVRNGIPVSQALLSIDAHSKSEKALLIAISRTLSYGSIETSNRLRKYLVYRQERKRIVAEYMGKMAVLSLRLKVLSAIAAASLAVIAFTSPLLGSLSSGAEIQQRTRIDWSIPTIALFSVSILCPFLYARTVPSTNGSRVAAVCGIFYIFVFVALNLTIGWRF